MNIFGWIMLSVLAVFGIFILILFVIPFIVTECKTMQEKIKRAIADKQYDLEKRSEERRHRDEIKRAKDFELANRKLDAKLQKVDKQIALQQKKLSLAKQLKDTTTEQKAQLQKAAKADATVTHAFTPREKAMLKKDPIEELTSFNEVNED